MTMSNNRLIMLFQDFIVGGKYLLVHIVLHRDDIMDAAWVH